MDERDIERPGARGRQRPERPAVRVEEVLELSLGRSTERELARVVGDRDARAGRDPGERHIGRAVRGTPIVNVEVEYEVQSARRRVLVEVEDAPNPR